MVLLSECPSEAETYWAGLGRSHMRHLLHVTAKWRQQHLAECVPVLTRNTSMPGQIAIGAAKPGLGSRWVFSDLD